MITLQIRQDAPQDSGYPIRLTLKRTGQPDLEAEARIQFALTEREQEELRWYLEDYLRFAESVEAIAAQQVEALMKIRGEELYMKVLAANSGTQAVWFSIRNDLSNLRVEITTGVAEAASIPWELMCDPQMGSPISLRVKSFVRVQSNPNISFVSVPPAENDQIRLLYIACRPSGSSDVELRAVANRLLQDLAHERARFDIKALRPPTFEQFQKELTDAKEAGRPYHIVHFDGHGVYADLSKSNLADWVATLSSVTLGTISSGKHGYLLFEHPSEDKMRPVDGQTMGQLLRDNGVPILILNACQSAMQGGVPAHSAIADVHDEVRAIGSLAQAVIDQGIPAVLGMRYSVYVVTAAQYIGQLYSALAKGRSFGQAATEGRKHLQFNPDRWVGLRSHPLQDWFVPVVHEAMPVELFGTRQLSAVTEHPELDPVQGNRALLRYVPEEGFIGRDETLLAMDRAFDNHRVVLLHAYAGQGKSSTAVEFARWYAITGGLGEQPLVLFVSFETHTDLNDLLNQIGQPFAQFLGNPGVDWIAENDPVVRLTIVKRILRNFPILWIWDNVEPVAGFPEGVESQWAASEQDDLRDFLKQLKLDSTSKVKILLTSRRDEEKWLGKIPFRIPMPRMRNSDAAKLALKIGEERNLNRSGIAEWQPLLDYCSGNPLTLRVLVGQTIRAGLRGKQIESFVEGVRGGEQRIEDADDKHGRDKSLGASLDYGFRHAFEADELPIIALLHLFQGTVDIDVLCGMSRVGAYALPELKDKTKEYLIELLGRAKETGLLTQIGPAYFTIHPALPWFLRQLFASHYDGQAEHSTSQAAVRAWVEAVGELGTYYHDQFRNGNRGVIDFLEMEESTFLHGRRVAHRNRWWSRVISSMQGLHVLYTYQSRTAEWARLVEEIVPDFCTTDNEPIAGREDDYGIVMSYRVGLAMDHERDFVKAAALQEKSVKLSREQAADALALPENVPVGDEDRFLLQRLAASVFLLGRILCDQQNAACLRPFLESLAIAERIGDKAGEAITEFNLGHAYKDIPAIRDLAAAEAAYQRSLNSRTPNDALGHSKCIKQIGMVHQHRFLDALNCNEPAETIFRHFNAAENHYLQGLQLCPQDALRDLARAHAQLGTLYAQVGQLDDAREHLEQAAQYFEKTATHFDAGRTRLNIAVMYVLASQNENELSRQGTNLIRARAYAEAALRDFHHYQGRAGEEEAQTQDLLSEINQALGKLPQ